MATSLLGGATYTQNGAFTTGSGETSSVVVTLTANDTRIFNGGVAQSVNASIALQNRTVYEIGTNYYYTIMGRPSGQGSIQHLVGPNKKSFWATMNQWTGCKETTLEIKSTGSAAKCGKSGIQAGRCHRCPRHLPAWHFISENTQRQTLNTKL